MKEAEYKQFVADLLREAKNAKDAGHITPFQYRRIKRRSRLDICMLAARANLMQQYPVDEVTMPAISRPLAGQVIDWSSVDWEALGDFIERIITLIFTLFGDS